MFQACVVFVHEQGTSSCKDIPQNTKGADRTVPKDVLRNTAFFLGESGCAGLCVCTLWARPAAKVRRIPAFCGMGIRISNSFTVTSTFKGSCILLARDVEFPKTPFFFQPFSGETAYEDTKVRGDLVICFFVLSHSHFHAYNHAYTIFDSVQKCNHRYGCGIKHI
jgi:hypothetical protein